MKNSCKYIIGVTFLVLGVLWFLGSIGVIALNLLFKGWWTLFIIIPSLCAIFSSKDRTGGLFGLGLGVILLLCARDVLDWDIIWKLILALIFVIVGIKLIFSKNNGRMIESKNSKADGKDWFNFSFGNQKYNFDNEVFNGAKVKVSFGSLSLDLRRAKIENDCIIECECSFAGVEIMLPSNVKVECMANSTFGGIDNKFINFDDEGKPCVQIKGELVFGGIEIK